MQYTIEEFYKAKCISKLKIELGEDLEIERVPFGNSQILKVSFEYGIGGYLGDESLILTLFYFFSNLIAVEISGDIYCQRLYYRDIELTKNYDMLVRIMGIAEEHTCVVSEKEFKEQLIEALPLHILSVKI